jgi:hypothetical protein
LNKNTSHIFILALLFSASYLYPQQSKLSKSVNNISEFIASSEFGIIKNSSGELLAVDSLYSEALKLNQDDFSEVLLSLTFATVPYNEVPIQIPIIKSIITFPLISASDSIFNLKNENLPRYIYFDSPKNNYGDQDKLAHFFGSAFLTYSSNFFDLGNAIGYFVEVFEESFKVQSSIDERDLITNELGNMFGTLLKKNKKILPSQIIILRTLSNFNCSL